MTDKPLTDQENKIIHAFVEPGGEWYEWEDCIAMFANDNPDYTFQPHFDNFLRVLFSDAMCEAFEYHAGNAWAMTGTKQFLIPWLFSDHARFLRLFLDFLSLEGTQRDFGWEECPNKRGGCKSKCAKFDCIDGKVPRPWLRVWKEGKE